MSSALAPMSAWYVLTAFMASSVSSMSRADDFFARSVSFIFPFLFFLIEVMSRKVRPTASCKRIAPCRRSKMRAWTDGECFSAVFMILFNSVCEWALCGLMLTLEIRRPKEWDLRKKIWIHLPSAPSLEVWEVYVQLKAFVQIKFESSFARNLCRWAFLLVYRFPLVYLVKFREVVVDIVLDKITSASSNVF